MTLVQSAGIQVTNNLTFQAQLPPTITSPTLTASLTSPGSGGDGTGVNGSAPAAPAGVSLTGGAADAVSLAVPAALELSREGGSAGGVQMAVLATDGRAVIVSGLNRDGTLSVDLAGRVTLAGTVVEPGAYEGLLLVIAQYN